MQRDWSGEFTVTKATLTACLLSYRPLVPTPYWKGFRLRWSTIWSARRAFWRGAREWYGAVKMPFWGIVWQTVVAPWRVMRYLAGWSEQAHLLEWRK
jgi:hypothetical protein